MAVERASYLAYLAYLTGLTPAWCSEVLRLIAIDDVSGVVKAELSRLRKIANKRAAKSPEAKAREWNEAQEKQRIRERAHGLYATQIVRPHILESLALACWHSVVVQAKSKPHMESESAIAHSSYCERLKKRKTTGRPLTDDEIHHLWVQRQVGLRLGTDDSNIWRWEKLKTCPGGDKVLGAILMVLRVEFCDADFPPRRRLLIAASARTLAFIREKRYGKQKTRAVDRLPEPLELAVARIALRHGLADDLLPSSSSVNRTNLKILMSDTSDALSEENSGLAPKPEAIKMAISEWGMTYAFYLVALASGWTDGRDGDQFWKEIE